MEAENAALKQKIEKIESAARTTQREGAETRSLGRATLKSRLEQCFRDHIAALMAEEWSDAAEIAETTKELTAALRDAVD